MIAALEEVALRHGMGLERRPPSWWDDPPYSNRPQLCFWNLGPNFDWSKFSRYKSRNPYARLVTFGGDTQYWLRLEQFDWSAIDLNLEPSQCAVDKVRELGVRCEQFFWSVSGRSIVNIQRYYGFGQRWRPIDALGLYRGTPERKELFAGLVYHGHSVVLSPGEWDFYRTIDYYMHAKVAVGTTSSPVPGWARGMKGYRDWIAPFAGCVLVYDDYPDAQQAWDNIVPFYRYGKPDSLAELIVRLSCDQPLRERYLARQQAWARQHTTDRQFEALFARYGLLEWN